MSQHSTQSHYPSPQKSQDVVSRTLSVMVDNEPGVLARVIGLFTSRGYNIDSLTVTETEHEKHVSRITILTRGTPAVITEIADTVISNGVLNLVPEKETAASEMRRVLKPNGWLLFSTHHPAADAARLGTHNYFETEHVVDHWDWVGRVEFFRRGFVGGSKELVHRGIGLDQGPDLAALGVPGVGFVEQVLQRLDPGLEERAHGRVLLSVDAAQAPALVARHRH